MVLHPILSCAHSFGQTGCFSVPVGLTKDMYAYTLSKIAAKINADAAYHHADPNTIILPSGQAERGRMGVCNCSWCRVHGAVPHRQADIQVCSTLSNI